VPTDKGFATKRLRFTVTVVPVASLSKVGKTKFPAVTGVPVMVRVCPMMVRPSLLCVAKDALYGGSPPVGTTTVVYGEPCTAGASVNCDTVSGPLIT